MHRGGYIEGFLIIGVYLYSRVVTANGYQLDVGTISMDNIASFRHDNVAL